MSPVACHDGRSELIYMACLCMRKTVGEAAESLICREMSCPKLREAWKCHVQSCEKLMGKLKVEK